MLGDVMFDCKTVENDAGSVFDKFLIKSLSFSFISLSFGKVVSFAKLYPVDVVELLEDLLESEYLNGFDEKLEP